MEPITPMESTGLVTGFRLTQRDISILSEIESMREITALEIQNRFWDGKNNFMASRRLRKLASQNLIEIVSNHSYRVPTYVLTDAGHSLLRSTGCALFERKPVRPRFPSARHEQIVRDVYRALKTIETIRYVTPDHVLVQTYIELERTGRLTFASEQVPDLVIWPSKGSLSGNPIAVELELTIKSKRRYRKIFENYARKNKYDAFVFVFEMDNQRFLFTNVLALIRKSSPILGAFFNTKVVATVSLEQFLKQPLTATLHHCDTVTNLEELLKK
jgi:hypothetical protein